VVAKYQAPLQRRRLKTLGLSSGVLLGCLGRGTAAKCGATHGFVKSQGAGSGLKSCRGDKQTPRQTVTSKLCATLDLSRRLRLDKRHSPHHGAQESDLGIDVRPASETRTQPDGSQVQPPSARSPPESSQTLVFYGDAQQVREGFALALRAMEGITHSQPIDFTFPWGRPNREDS
jgi:hypothetical protein